MKEKHKKLISTVTKLCEYNSDIALCVIESIFEINQRWKEALSKEEFIKLTEMAFLTKSVLGKYTKAVIVESKNGTFAVDTEDCMIGLELRLRGEYDNHEIDNIKEFVNPSSRLLVVGAHIGTLVVPLCKSCAHLVAIEANPSTYKLLATNLNLNKIDNCTAYQIAASDKQEVIPFLANKVNSGGSKRKPLHDQYMYNYDSPLEINVEAYALDNYLENESFDVIVMDLEGSEYFALKGMSHILRKAQVLIVEFVPHHFKNISGASVDDFVELLSDFDSIIIPSKGIKGTSEHFSVLLNMLYDNNVSEEGVIFEKVAK